MKACCALLLLGLAVAARAGDAGPPPEPEPCKYDETKGCATCDPTFPLKCATCTEATYIVDATGRCVDPNKCKEDVAWGCETCATDNTTRCATCTNPAYIVDAQGKCVDPEACKADPVKACATCSAADPTRCDTCTEPTDIVDARGYCVHPKCLDNPLQGCASCNPANVERCATCSTAGWIVDGKGWCADPNACKNHPENGCATCSTVDTEKCATCVEAAEGYLVDPESGVCVWKGECLENPLLGCATCDFYCPDRCGSCKWAPYGWSVVAKTGVCAYKAITGFIFGHSRGVGFNGKCFPYEGDHHEELDIFTSDHAYSLTGIVASDHNEEETVSFVSSTLRWEKWGKRDDKLTVAIKKNALVASLNGKPLKKGAAKATGFAWFKADGTVVWTATKTKKTKAGAITIPLLTVTWNQAQVPRYSKGPNGIVKKLVPAPWLEITVLVQAMPKQPISGLLAPSYPYQFPVLPWGAEGFEPEDIF